MKHDASHEPALCTRFHRASELIGRRWNGAIIYVLLQQTCRFATLRDAIPGITDRMLSERLQELEEEGLVDRTVLPDTPVRVEYSLTKKGKSLAEAIGTIAKWAEKYVPLADAKPRPRSRASR
jgi:DNA-binding HxlR family transcriptional regulator